MPLTVIELLEPPVAVPYDTPPPKLKKVKVDADNASK
jgi:hypothetical protein